jgi:hypothetical protein
MRDVARGFPRPPNRRVSATVLRTSSRDDVDSCVTRVSDAADGLFDARPCATKTRLSNAAVTRRGISSAPWCKALKRCRYRRVSLSRHTRVSWHVQNGTPLHVLEELGGRETPSMVRRYAHFGSDHLATSDLCREGRTHDGRKSVTATFSLKTNVTVRPRNARMIMVARGGIERRVLKRLALRRLASNHHHADS